MQLVPYIVVDASGEPVRFGRCQESDFWHQAKEGERVAIPTDELFHRFNARRQAQLQPVAVIRESRATAPTAQAVLLEALRAKGIDVTPADLAAAASRLRSARP